MFIVMRQNSPKLESFLSYLEINKLRRQKKGSKRVKLYRSGVVKIVKIRLKFEPLYAFNLTCPCPD